MRQTLMRILALSAAVSLLVTALPATASATPRVKRPDKDGSVPAKWDLPTPVIPSDDTTPTEAGGDGDGSNTLSFTACDDGDIICVGPGNVFLGHTGIWKDSLYGSLYTRCLWSANTSPVNGVQLEAPIKYRGFDFAYALWVPSRYTYGTSVVNWCAAQAGEPFDISSSKTDYSRWYCSKLAWAGWKVRAGVDLDADGGYWVKPADLVNDSETRTFAYSD